MDAVDIMLNAALKTIDCYYKEQLLKEANRKLEYKQTGSAAINRKKKAKKKHSEDFKGFNYKEMKESRRLYKNEMDYYNTQIFTINEMKSKLNISTNCNDLHDSQSSSS
ncbi:uncharacterized protein LOC119665493 [Teleopsis dalmanni]|uniref:uncharacterized protein LOC119665493 n=1 Tax=Teleopsis dalmanni TaxID=139649 RepID=UPI0018CD31B0|nr:uncharacterized protein LOC119665493 [Teleopsis dalmanni]